MYSVTDIAHWKLVVPVLCGQQLIRLKRVYYFSVLTVRVFCLTYEFRLEDMDSVDAFFHAMAQTVKQLKPITVAKIKRTVSIIVSNAEIEEMETSVSCGRFPMNVPIITEPKM